MTSKDLLEIVKTAEQQGWRVERTKLRHFKWISPTGAVVFTGSTMPDSRAVLNVKRDLRAKGMVFVDKKKKR